MKTKHFFALTAAICLTSTISFAQNGGNSNPYAIFGARPYIAGDRADLERVKVLIVENIAEGSQVARLEHDTQTGVVTFFDLDGNALGTKQLKQGERAWPTLDPKAEKYYSISPYAYTMNNPVRYIDPNGMEVWEFDNMGNVLNHTKTKEHDAFYVMHQVDGEWQRSGQELVMDYGTVTSYLTPTVKVSNGAGGYNEMQLTIFEMKGDNNASQLFEFMANPGVTTNSEWSHVKIGTESSGRNIVGTNQGRDFSAVNDYVLQRNYTVREDNHSHVYSNTPSGADRAHATRVNTKFPNATLHNYYAPVGYTQYNSAGIVAPTVMVPVVVRPR